ncbi:glucan endo-1,3-beta-D-glucosidase 1 [Salvia miltiorrhiza]|uniref:glucan endo-1,3-beta-D-glucosidase 1 n=1 Tax=Salvia miltiorrhiza TaxID=226208 RepID=UPI0025ACBBB1|nr:glucan endo-1,3-beta-D-glucosidase 1 [Salvia miltiorrhiza]XP_057769909.1 glucan endo-1,3-beta-D-glucosidase 1 [Salvia miltiorrhiza]
MLRKIKRRVKTVITKPFNKKRRPKKPPSAPPTPSPSPPMSPPPPSSPAKLHRSRPFIFPQTHSAVLPDPSRFFAPHLLAAPLPTNSFFQNFALKNGDQPEYIHPYLIKSSQSSLTLCYPSLFTNPAFIYQVFVADLTISTLNNPNPSSTHVISSFSDLGVTLDFPSNNLRFFLVRGSPYLTCSVLSAVCLSISTIHAVLELTPNSSCTKYTIRLNNNQTWLLYASSPVNLSHDINMITSSTVFSGVIRIAALPVASPKFESILDQFSSCYAVRGDAVFTKPFSLDYKWEKRGWGDLLMLAHPLHLRLLSDSDCSVSVLDDFKYDSIDGELVGVVGDSWALKSEPVSVTWHSIKGVEESSCAEIIEALVNDVAALDARAVTTPSSYFYAKLVARAARLALIAEEVCYTDVIPAIKQFLKQTIEPWLEGTFGPNGFLYDAQWGGIVTKQGSLDSGADFGFGVYNDHHYHLGYFVYGIAVLAKIDSTWGRKYRAQAYALMADYMNLSRRENSNYTRLRCFDLWKLHSWAGGLTEFADGRNQESTSEAVNAYYSAALMGLAYGDSHLIWIGSTISAFEILAAETWWHVKEEGKSLYPAEFVRDNRVVGVLWASKRDSGLWFAPADWKECRLGIQLLPLLPISEALFSDARFVRQLVEWTVPALAREGVGEGWKGFVYALQGMYDKGGALANVRSLNGYDDGNSLTNLLWWIHSRDDQPEEYSDRLCWFRHYSH